MLDTVAGIARGTGSVAVSGTYAPEEEVNDFHALEAIAMRHGGTVRDMLLARGVLPDLIRLNGLVSHPQASQSGAEIWVCTPYRNVDNGWRERPLDPDLVVRGSIRGRADAPVLHVPIGNLGPYVWNNLPVGDTAIFEFRLDREDDPATFADVQFRCHPTDADADCTRLVWVYVRPWPRTEELSRGDRSGPFEPVSRRTMQGRRGEQRIVLTRRWPDDATSVANVECLPYVRPPPPVMPARPANDPLACDARLSLGPARLQASVSFTTVGETEALKVVDRARRDLLRFARAEAVQ